MNIKKEKNNNRKWVILLLLIFSVILMIFGLTYRLSNNNNDSNKEENPQENAISEEIKFSYKKNQTGIDISDAIPVSDAVAKAYQTEGQVFDFSIEAINSSDKEIPYEITFIQKGDSTLPSSAIKIYLTDITTGIENEILEPVLYSKLKQTNVNSGNNIEKTLYIGTVDKEKLNYLKNFRLRVWIDENININNDEYQNKTFIGVINIYSNGKLVSGGEVLLKNDINISSIVLEDEKIEQQVVNEKNNYEKTIPSLAPTDENIISKDTDNTLKDLSVTGCTLSPSFSSNKTEYTCTVKSTLEKTTVIAKATSIKATVEGTGEKSLSIGDNPITIKVTAEDGTTKSYTVIITRPIQLLYLTDAIMNENPTKYENPTLTTSSNNTTDANGLYKSTDTNTGKPTYYFRGEIENNYVEFAGFKWRVVRINEDGTTRLIMQDGINSNTTYKFNTTYKNYTNMYYTNSEAKIVLDNWYMSNLLDHNDKIATGDYFCEQAKVKYSSLHISGSAVMSIYSSYTPTFKCENDDNIKGIVSSNIGLITYDEAVFAGSYHRTSNETYYLTSGEAYWTMSPAGSYKTSNTAADVWRINSIGDIEDFSVSSPSYILRPVINLKADVTVTGSGTNDDPWKVTELKNTDDLESLNIAGCDLNPSFSNSKLNYTCTVSALEKITVTAKAKNQKTIIEGTGEKSLSTGKNIITIKVTAENGATKSYTIVVTKFGEAVYLKDAIMNKYTTIYENPTFPTLTNITTDISGLYKSTDTNSGEPTYYFRGDIENNYVEFAGYKWRIVRINEDGTIRLIMQDGINDNAAYKFNSSYKNYTNMYYTNTEYEYSEARVAIDEWYLTNLVNYNDKIVKGEYFCEQARVKSSSSYVSGSAVMSLHSDYTPTFKCETDGYGKGIVNSNIGLLTYDEVMYAGGDFFGLNSNYYLNTGNNFWTMSPAGIYPSSANNASVWVASYGFHSTYVYYTSYLRPVLNLKADIAVTGSGTNSDPWKVVF